MTPKAVQSELRLGGAGSQDTPYLLLIASAQKAMRDSTDAKVAQPGGK